MIEMILLFVIFGVLFLILMIIGLLKKKKFKGYLKILNFFEGGFESED